MEINTSKCSLMSIPHREIESNIKLNNEIVGRIDKYKYLGVEISKFLNFKDIADHRIRVGYQTIDSIKNFLLNKSIPLIIKTVLIPRLTYGIDIFGFSLSNLKTIK